MNDGKASLNTPLTRKIVPVVVSSHEPLRPNAKVGAPKKRESHPEIKTNSSFSIILSTLSQVEGLVRYVPQMAVNKIPQLFNASSVNSFI